MDYRKYIMAIWLFLIGRFWHTLLGPDFYTVTGNFTMFYKGNLRHDAMLKVAGV